MAHECRTAARAGGTAGEGEGEGEGVVLIAGQRESVPAMGKTRDPVMGGSRGVCVCVCVCVCVDPIAGRGGGGGGL